MADPVRLGDAAVRQRLADLDELLAQVEAIPGPAGELAVEAVAALAQVYGEALARAAGHASAAPDALEAMLGDELIGHLLVLHGAHPEPVDRRVERALAGVAAVLERHGARAELSGIESGLATLMVSVSGCGSSAGPVRDAVREAVLAVAPELSDVRFASPERAAAFVPVDRLLRPPAGSGPAR